MKRQENKHIARPVGGYGGCDAPSKSVKRPTFSHKMGQKCGLCKRVKGMRFKKSTFWGPTPPPQINPGYGPAHCC